jgi:hypothetical protein
LRHFLRLRAKVFHVEQVGLLLLCHHGQSGFMRSTQLSQQNRRKINTDNMGTLRRAKDLSEFKKLIRKIELDLIAQARLREALKTAATKTGVRRRKLRVITARIASNKRKKRSAKS